MTGNLSVQDIVNFVRGKLEAASTDDPLRDARLIVSHVAGLKLLDLVTSPSQVLSVDLLEKALELAERRAKGESIHRILGHREFYDLDLIISKETLEPRPDTEVLVDALLPYLEKLSIDRNVRILDLGTGTGAICLALLSNSRNTTGVGVDISEDALKTAALNADNNGLASRFTGCLSDWFSAVEGEFDVIVSNPPYIRSDVINTLDVVVKSFDPPRALDGGEDGLEPYRIIAREAGDYLTVGGLIGVEIGYDQKESVTQIFADQGYELLESRKDYGGNDRVLIFGRAV